MRNDKLIVRCLVMMMLMVCSGVSYGEAYLKLGPMLGHVTERDAHFWVNSSEPSEAKIVVSEKSDLSEVVSEGVVKLMEEHANMGRVAVGGLKPETVYYYGVYLNGKAATMQPHVSFKTPVKVGSASRIRIAFSSCFGRHGSFSAAGWAQLATNAKADMILMLGDNHYGDTTNPERLRKFYFEQRNTPGFREATRGVASYAIWDDHDYGPNDSDRTAKGKEDSLRVFKEHHANPSYGEKDNDGIYTSFERGEVKVILLDSRYHRDPNKAEASPKKTMLGVKQKQWLKDQLLNTKAKIKLIGLGSEWQLNGHKDSLTSFRHEQLELFDFLRDSKIEGVFLLSGDRHFTGGYQIRGHTIEITSGPLGSKNFPTKVLPDMFMRQNEGKLYVVLDTDTRVSPPKVVLEVHRAGDGIVYKRELKWDEINGKVRLETLPADKAD